MDTAPEQVEVALRLLAEREDLRLRLVGRYASGEFGAYRLVNQEGQHFALKLPRERRVRRAAATTEVLRQAGYPAPLYLHMGAVEGDRWYAVLEEMPGQPLVLTMELVGQLLALIEKQAEHGFLPTDDRPVVETLLLGADGYALHETMRRHSAQTAELLEEVIAIGRRYAELDFPTGDIVHNDFHTGNMLVLDGQVSGVVDWDGTWTGDRAFDVATLLFYVSEDDAVESRLWRALLELTGLERASVYLAHMMLRQVEWSARNHDVATVQRYLGRSLGLLAEVRRRS